MKYLRALGIALLGFGFLGTNASAVVVDPVYEKVAFVSGFETSNDSFQVDKAGTYRATLTDLNFPANFTNLFLAVTTTSSVEGSLMGPGSFTFAATPGTTYFANVAGEAGGSLNLSLFGVDVALVPIPAAGVLFGSAVVGLLVVARRGRRQQAAV